MGGGQLSFFGAGREFLEESLKVKRWIDFGILKWR